MTSRRLLKAAQAVREVVSMAILTELRDPRVKYVTVTKVEVLPDMKQAKVYVTIMGDETQQRLSLRGLQNAAGFLQAKIAERIDTRYTPRLEFLLDEGAKNLQQIDQILRRVLPTDAGDEDEEDEDVEAEDDADMSKLDDDEADAKNERPDASS